MIGMKGQSVPLNEIKFPVLAQLKYDGVRLITTVRNHRVTFRTFNNNIVPLPKLADKLSILDDAMIDGEIMLGRGLMKGRTTASGMINSAMHGGSIDDGLLNYMSFDAMPLDHYLRKSCNLRYMLRYGLATKLAIQAKINIAPSQIVNSIKEVTELSEQLYRDGFEGLMLKSFDHMYQFKRSKDWAKIKAIKTVDLKCINWNEGSGKYDGMIGSLVCEGIAEGKDIQVNVGGLTDAYRAADPDMFIGKTIEVKYNSIIQDSTTGLWSLFSPRFGALRFDK